MGEDGAVDELCSGEVIWNFLFSLVPFLPANPSLMQPLDQGPFGMEALLLYHCLSLFLLL